MIKNFKRWEENMWHAGLKIFAKQVCFFLKITNNGKNYS